MGSKALAVYEIIANESKKRPGVSACTPSRSGDAVPSAWLKPPVNVG
jgi:hypothetical protein